MVVVMVGPVAVVLQTYEIPPVAVSVAVMPAQTTGSLTVTEGGVLTVTVPLAVAVQVAALVTVTVYVVFEAGETEIVWVVAPPGDQLYVAGDGELAVRKAF